MTDDRRLVEALADLRALRGSEAIPAVARRELLRRAERNLAEVAKARGLAIGETAKDAQALAAELRSRDALAHG